MFVLYTPRKEDNDDFFARISHRKKYEVPEVLVYLLLYAFIDRGCCSRCSSGDGSECGGD